MIYVVLALILAAVVVYVLYIHGIIKLPKLGSSVPTSTPAPAAPTQPQTVTLPGTNQQVSSVTDAFLRSGAGYGRTDAPAPTGSIDNSPTWTSFDGHRCRVTANPGAPMVFSANVGKPFTLSVSEAGTGTDGTGTMTLTAVQNGKEVATISKHFGQAVDLPVPVGDAVVTAVYDKVSTFDVTVRQG